MKMEETIYYPEQYAGTADLIGIYQGKDVIIDFKQSNKPKKTDYIQDYLLTWSIFLVHDVVHGNKADYLLYKRYSISRI